MKRTNYKRNLCLAVSIIFIICLMISAMYNQTTAYAESEEESKQEDISNIIFDNNEADVITAEEGETTDQNISEILSQQDESTNLSIPINASLSITSTKQDIIDSILSNETFTIDGNIIYDSTTESLSTYYDFSKVSKYDITEWVYMADLISEEEKIEIFCDLILNRNFYNMDCLEGVFDEILEFYENIDSNIIEKIDLVLNVPFTTDSKISTASISSESTYTSTNFNIHYDDTNITSAEAKTVADYFETVRTAYINLGFNTPKLQLFKSTYQVYLDPDSDPDGSAAATTVKSTTLTNTCASYIIIYNFSSLTSTVKERIAHEYFHAIQNAYNHQSGWFKEACANWGKEIVGGSLNSAKAQINSFISSNNTSMPLANQYGAVLFPLAIHYNYGGSSSILSIYEEYNNYKANIELSELRTVITNGIVNNGYTSGSFDFAYRRMASFLIDTSVWFKNLGYNSWSNVSTTTWATSTSSTQTYTGSLNYLASNYYHISIPSEFTGSVKIDIEFSSSKGALQTYTIDNNNCHSISYFRTTTDGSSYAEKSDICEDITDLYLILSNLDNSETITFTANLSLYDYGNSITFNSSDRYTERLCYIPCNGYEEIAVTFNTSGSKTIQTFGEYDTKIELYSANGTLLASDDDSGYSLNALIRYYTSANTTYIIRIKLYSSSRFGETQLAITPAYGALSSDSSVLSKYEDIYSISTTTFTWNSFAEQYYTRMVRFIPSSSSTYTFELDSTFDNYIYVIDPRYARIQVKNIDYNDDGGSGLNAKLSKNLKEDVPYLVIYSAYNPGNSSSVGDLVLTISK